MMKGLETGRIQVASRALGVATAALEDALRYAQERESFGQPIWKHQAVGHYLADMATKLTAARQLTLYAARALRRGERCDMEAGMAKLFASEVAMEIALNAVRIHGGYGYSTEFDVERYFRDAPLMIVGEGTNEIQRNVIASQLVARGGICDEARVPDAARTAARRDRGGPLQRRVRLPTESELVARHGLSRQTVRTGVSGPGRRGRGVPGAGPRHVRQRAGRRYLRQLGSIEDLMSLSDDTTMEVLAGLRRRVDVDAASRLRLDDDVVYSVVFRRLHDGVPFVLTTVHLVPSVAQPVLASSALAEGAVGTHTVIGLLEPHLSGADRRSGAVDHGRAGRAGRRRCRRVRAGPSDAAGGPAVLGSAGRPVELSVSHFLPEQYTYRVTLRRSG